MKNKTGINKRTTIIISVIIGIIITLLVNFYSPAVRTAFTEPKPTKEAYDNLKEYAIQEAMGLHVDANEDIKVDKNLEGEVLKIRIEVSMLYGLEAKFPIDEASIEIENGIIEYKGIIDYDNATYLEYTYIKDRIICILQSLLMAVLIAIEATLLLNLPNLIKNKKKQ